jgi:predicted RNase H-like nuclease (RuvC/YqgF family)
LRPAGDAIVPESSAPAIDEAEQRQEPRAEKPKRYYEPDTEPITPSITTAIEQVNKIIDELKHSLDEMEEVLETLELAERQKIDDEREIESLQRALRQLHRPAPGGGAPPRR